MKPGQNASGLLVCLTGIDGSGKSTLAKAMAASLEAQGIRCRYVWMGFNDSFTVFRPLVALAKGSILRGSSYME